MGSKSELQDKIINMVLERLDEPVKTTYHRLTIIQGLNDKGLPSLSVWVNKQSHPFCNQYFLDVDSAERHLAGIKGDERRKIEHMNARKKTIDFDVGDIFVSVWGHEQTNVDAYQVVEKPSKCFAIIRKIKNEVIKVTGDMSSIVRPVADAFSSEDTMRVKVNGFGACLKPYAQLKKWDGQRAFGESSYA